MRSCTDFTGDEDGTTITGVTWPSMKIGVRSFCESYRIWVWRWGAAVIPPLLLNTSCVAVGRRLRRGLNAERFVAPRTVVDHERLPP